MVIALCAVAFAAIPEPYEAIDPILQRIYDEGHQLEERQQFSAAAVRYRLVAAQVENWRQPTLDLARVLEAQGRTDEARRVYAEYPDDADVIEAHGRLELAQGDPSLAASLFRRLRNLRPEWPGARLLEADARALSEPDLAAGLVEEYLGFTITEPAQDNLSPITARVAQGLRAHGDHVAAVALIEDVVARFPELASLLTLRSEIEVDEVAQALAAAADQRLTPEQIARLREARAAFAADRIADARERLEQLAVEQPLSAVTWGTLADVREASGDIAGAEQAIRAAERLDPISAAYPAKLGELLVQWYGGRFDIEAVAAFARATSRRPDDADLWYRKALAERHVGRWSQSIASFERMLAIDPGNIHALEARVAIEGSGRDRTSPIVFPAAHVRPTDVSEEAWWAFHRAWAWTLRPEADAADRALRELSTARALSSGFVRALDLEASIRADRGELTAAIALIEESLSREPERGSVVGTLAALYERSGRRDEAAALWQRAASLGDADALWQRAQAEASAWRWSTARATLAEYFAHTTGSRSYEAAIQLDAALVERIRASRIAAVLGVILVVLLSALTRWWMRSGATVDEWLQQSPASWREVARITSAIRHEVLKHHTTVLPTVADAIDSGEHDQPRWLAERLYGSEGALARLDAYIDELKRLARACGVRLSLRVRDPVFAPMLAHIARLRRLRSALEGGGSPKVASRLRQIGTGLNTDAYQALGRLVARLCVTRIDAAVLREVHHQVQNEPELRGTPVSLDLDLPDSIDDIYVPMFPADLSDLVANLLRNAMYASLLDGPATSCTVGIALRLETDDITELESAVLRIQDRAAGHLTTEALRSRLISRGLGLVVELTSRAGGSVRVEPEPGWRKAVVVRLPRAERPR